MKIVVLKFGGTSVGTTDKIKKVAEIITGYKKKNFKVIVVSSAMSGVTNELIKKSTEREKFSEIAEEWWDPNGKFKPLHKFNPIRILYIKENIIKTFNLKANKTPLNDIKILDVGCGGGLLSEPICRLGAKVTAIDASKKNIEVAKLHAKKKQFKNKLYMHIA